ESIKKMLENLPPKRICKKIFPALTKTKKAKFITKHKIFSSQGRLRSTRARQISKLSKVKCKFSNKSTKNKKVLHHKAEKMLSKNKTKKLTLATFSNNVERDNGRNFKNLNDKLVPAGTTSGNTFCSITNVGADIGKCGTPSLPSKEPSTAVECAAEIIISAPEHGNFLTESRVCDSLRSNKSGQQTDLQKQTALCASGNNELKNNSQYIDTATCSKKRSKKINDCIAMLTGKLEEKLKTEQNSFNKDEPYMETDINNEHKSKSSAEIKPPKRKTVSRKIIKMDNATPQPTVAKVQTALESLTRTPSNIPKLPNAPVVANAPLEKLIPLSTSSSTITASKLSVQTNANVNYLNKNTNINLSQENTKCPLLNKQTPLITANIDPIASTIVPITLASSDFDTALLMPKPPPAVFVNKIPPSLSKPSAMTELVPPFPTLPLTHPMQNMPVNNIPPPPPVLAVLPQPPLLPTPVSITPLVPVAAMAPMSAIVPGGPMTPILPVAPLFNSEPLNLSNTKSVKKHTPNELLCFNPYRGGSGIPVRRQTICGFEARNFILEDEPLDLSKKSGKDQTQDASAVMTLTPLIKPIETHSITPVGINMTMAPPNDAVLNKQFYSNLELLKIPQIRNPGNTTTTETVLVNPTPKCSSRKRNSSKNTNENASKPVTTNSGKGANKESSLHKRDILAKGKTSLKMDEEVINHIDDAINSVINAVKASLPDSDEKDSDKTNKLAQKSNHTHPINPIPALHLRNSTPVEQLVQTQPMASQMVLAKSSLSDAVVNLQKTNEEAAVIEKDNSKESIVFLPQKRYVRSKTLDCRPNVLATMPEIVLDSLHTTTTLTTSKNSESSPNIENSSQCKMKSSVGDTPLPGCETISCQKTCTDLSVSNETQIIDKEPLSFSTEPNKEVNNCVSPTVGIFNDINPNLITEENMSNINNTSSGFHSCGQVENTIEAKKKQRRRRKNELAAIVADQLLESFKIDKTRRDNLKRLENLAYEKSEDLFVTGMLLMSSTKRTVTSSKNDQLNNDVSSSKNIEAAGRQKQDQSKPKTSKARLKQNITCNKSTQVVDEVTPSISTINEPSEKTKEKDVTIKRNKKRNYRGKGKPLDNENISKLKSSLESFSIGIEKQLTELEARNSAPINVSETKSHLPAAARSSLLRPSILSANTETNINNQIAPTVETKSVVSSRDPRLNKNIHKNENNENSEACDREKNMEEICDVEEDNYLTEIAKNVNEKIMSAENEEFMFINDGFELANELQDDSNSKFYSRPPTSMSVRSAPNFNDDRSNFGSICDENTNTEVMDMDLEDELSVYTSYSQDVGRGRSRRRRRRRSILLKRRPKKRVNHDSTAEKFECTLCKKVFYTLHSLTKHNMTLAHVSKLSAQEYLLSKSLENTPPIICKAVADNDLKTNISAECIASKKSEDGNEMQRLTERKGNDVTDIQYNNLERVDAVDGSERRELNDGGKVKIPFNNTSRLNLNPDERLFFECCNILKGAETACVNNDKNGRGAFEYNFKEKSEICSVQGSIFKSLRPEILKKQITLERVSCKSAASQQEFRSPPALQSNTATKGVPTIAVRDQ
ncbi:uncharacterized protein LOC118753546, partial [Rhagoletis pomonella]|uniref:uncharacterized protein LOC118753546 n=1 Tax=Rhagoletis pomonella TaxID=28610 RepID=UPI00177B86E7